MKSFHLSEIASARLFEIGEYTELQWGIPQRNKYLDALDARFVFLANSPYKGRPRDDLEFGLRCFPEGKHVIYYFVQENGIFIADILHQSEDIESRNEGWTRN